MARNAGFGFAASLTEELINGILAAYSANFSPAYQFPLPAQVSVLGETIGFSGGLVLLAPRVTLRANVNDTVQAWIAAAGRIDITGGPLPGTYELVLAATLELGILAAVTPASGRQTITVGLDLSKTALTGIDAAVYAGNPLQPAYVQALNAGPVLDALNAAIQQIPPALVQLTPPGFGLPLTKSVAYQPPQHAQVPSPRTLFAVSLAVSTVAVRPVSSADGSTGALAIGVDLLLPETQGDPAALIDLNTTVAPVGYALTPTEDGFSRGSVQDPTQPHGSQFAAAVNTTVITGIVNHAINPQLSQKFVSGQIAFAPPSLNDGAPPDYDCVNLELGWFTPSLGPQPLFGLVLSTHLVWYSEVQRWPDGYPVATEDIDASINATASFTLDLTLAGLRVEPPPEPPAGAATANVTFNSAPAGSYFYLDDGLVELGLPPFDTAVMPLTLGTHTLTAAIDGFESWTAVAPNSFDNPYAGGKAGLAVLPVPSGTLQVSADGAVTLATDQWQPLLGANSWSMTLQDVDVALPWWATPAMIVLGPLYAAVTAFVSLFTGADIWWPDLLGNELNSIAPMVQDGVNGGLDGLPLIGQTIAVLDLPGTNAPNFFISSSDLVLSAEGFEAYFALALATPTRAQGDAGSVPYLLITDQDITDPGSIVIGIDTDGPYPQRVDGVFARPLAPGAAQGFPTAQVTWTAGELRPINAVLKIPAGLVNAEDPSVQVTWIVTSGVSGTVLQTSTGSLVDGPAVLWFSVEHASAALQAESNLVLTLAVTQPAGGGTLAALFATTVDITILDHFDRRNRFVRWGPSKAIYSPGIPFWNATMPAPGVVKKRYERDIGFSRIHRTDIWSGGGRCLVASTSGRGFHLANKLRGRGFLPDKNDTARTLAYAWTYSDTLPFTAAQIAADRSIARGVLCDYCFFGGPDKAVLRADFPIPID